MQLKVLDRVQQEEVQMTDRAEMKSKNIKESKHFKLQDEKETVKTVRT